ncbi:MAG: 30S ribosomal protein S1 [Bacteroidetes bacterium]|nr:30S ribosomal protein S1 [Bacteroidota bacterium]
MITEAEEITNPSPEIPETVVAAPKPFIFNWDSVDTKGGENYTAEERSRLEQIYDNTLNSVVEHEIVEGTVVSISSKDVLINIGFKSDGLVPLTEFRHMPDLKIGDKVEVYVETQEDKNGQLILSHKQARALKSWDRVNAALEKEEVIQGFVKCRTKGGLIVDVFGIEAFLPGSQIDVKPIRDYDQFVGKTMEFKVVKINNEFKNVVVSHKILIEEELEQQKAEIMKKLEKGQVLEGTVKNITSYGVFMDLGGVDGLLHITDISWGRISHPEEVLKLDQKVNVVILDFDDEKKRIALGLKQLTPHPWSQLDENLKVGDKVKGKVVVIADYGAFVEITQGVEGLIHVSEMSWSQHLRSPHEFLKVADEIEAVILTLDREERKMSLGIKQLKPDPWTNVALKYPVGSKHKSTVKNFQNFGVFVELEEGIDGLVHISDLSWQKKIKHPSEFCKIGDPMEVVVLEVDAENRRLSLGHKQLEDNPWEVFETIFTLDSIHEGTLIKLTDKGAIIALPYGIEGFAPAKHLVKEDGRTLKVDEKAEFKILEFSKENKRILVSHSRLHEEKTMHARNAEHSEKERDRDEGAKAVKKIKESQEKTTLGDLSVLSNLKNEMESAEKKSRTKKAEEEAAVNGAVNGAVNDSASEEVKASEEEKKEE